MGHPHDVERATDLHFAWCQALMQKAQIGTTHRAAPQMRAVFMELRDVLPPDQVLAVANALPALERGIFLENWTLPHHPRPVGSVTEFRDRIYDRVKGHHERYEELVEDVFWVFQHMLEPTKADAIRSALPFELLALWPPADATRAMDG
jgi:uncharacterized protein (DUF2267 family)